MIHSILQHTPVWVWVLFCVLIALGIAQTREREVSIARATILPILMIALSLSGVLSAFSQVPLACGAWLAGFFSSLQLFCNSTLQRWRWHHHQVRADQGRLLDG